VRDMIFCGTAAHTVASQIRVIFPALDKRFPDFSFEIPEWCTTVPVTTVAVTTTEVTTVSADATSAAVTTKETSGATGNSTTQTQSTTTKESATPDQYVIGGNLSRERVVTTYILEDLDANSGKVLSINAPNGNFLVEREPYAGNFKREGLTLHIYYDPEKDGSYNKVGSVNSKQIPTSDGQIYIGISFDSTQKTYNDYVPSLGKNSSVIDGVYWFTLSTKNYSANGVATGRSALNASGTPVFQFNGTSIVKLSK